MQGTALTFQESFLKYLSTEVATPTQLRPTVHCWTKKSFERACRDIRGRMAEAGIKSDVSHQSLLEWLRQIGLIRPVPTDREEFYLLELGVGNLDVDPLELLVAKKPSGVVCFFSAIVFYGLTRQQPDQHHVADLAISKQIADEKRTREKSAVDQLDDHDPRSSRSPGTFLFHFQGVPFYASRRSARMVPGVQTRAHGPKTLLRITTKEQTLLDALHKPFYCGGPEVVFEAWDEVLSTNELDENRLAEHLQEMNYSATARRVGALLENRGHEPSAELRQVMQRYREEIDRTSPYARISLLPGVPYTNLNEHWMVDLP